MKELSSATVLALHALHAMMLKGTPLGIPELARSSGFGAERIRPILVRLQREGLILSRPGHGFLLARSPGDITLHDIIQAIGESRPPAAPCGGDFEACDSRASCILAPLCRKAEEGFRETLLSFTLAELRGAPLDLPNCVTPDSRSGR